MSATAAQRPLFPRRPCSAPDLSAISIMLLLLLEALGALCLFLFIVWWTMFSGRKKGELPDQREADAGKGDAPAPPPDDGPKPPSI